MEKELERIKSIGGGLWLHCWYSNPGERGWWPGWGSGQILELFRGLNRTGLTFDGWWIMVEDQKDEIQASGLGNNVYRVE